MALLRQSVLWVTPRICQITLGQNPPWDICETIPMVARTLQEVSDICLVVVTSVMTGVGVMYAVRYRVCEGKHCQG